MKIHVKETSQGDNLFSALYASSADKDMYKQDMSTRPISWPCFFHIINALHQPAFMSI